MRSLISSFNHPSFLPFLHPPIHTSIHSSFLHLSTHATLHSSFHTSIHPFFPSLHPSIPPFRRHPLCISTWLGMEGIQRYTGQVESAFCPQKAHINETAADPAVSDMTQAETVCPSLSKSLIYLFIHSLNMGALDDTRSTVRGPWRWSSGLEGH